MSTVFAEDYWLLTVTVVVQGDMIGKTTLLASAAQNGAGNYVSRC